MIEKTANSDTGLVPSRPGRIASAVKKIMGPISTYTAYIGAGVLGALVLMLMYSILARRLANAPLMGSYEMTQLGLMLIAFTMLALDSLHGESMIVEIIVERLPQRARKITAVVIHLLSTGILGILTWQLVVYGEKIRGFGQTTSTLGIPLTPFVYVAAFGTLLLTVIYLMHFLYSLDKACEK
jgi:TRAP-type transport system small permease protein